MIGPRPQSASTNKLSSKNKDSSRPPKATASTHNLNKTFDSRVSSRKDKAPIVDNNSYMKRKIETRYRVSNSSQRCESRQSLDGKSGRGSSKHRFNPTNEDAVNLSMGTLNTFHEKDSSQKGSKLGTMKNSQVYKDSSIQEPNSA